LFIQPSARALAAQSGRVEGGQIRPTAADLHSPQTPPPGPRSRHVNLALSIIAPARLISHAGGRVLVGGHPDKRCGTASPLQSKAASRVKSPRPRLTVGVNGGKAIRTGTSEYRSGAGSIGSRPKKRKSSCQ